MASDDPVYVLDFDRTLADTDEIMKFTLEVCSGIGIDADAVQAAYEASIKETRPYSPLYPIRQAGDDKLSAFKERFLGSADPDRFIYPDARRFLDKLAGLETPHMILTYATDELWQTLKLQAAGLDKIPVLITKNPFKGQDISAWQDQEGRFNFPTGDIGPSLHLRLVDDRLRVFEGLPVSCEGFYLDRKAPASATEALPSNVERITSFDQLIDRI